MFSPVSPISPISEPSLNSSNACAFGSYSQWKPLTSNEDVPTPYATRSSVWERTRSTDIISASQCSALTPPLPCDYCDKVFTGYYQRGNLSRHINTNHPDVSGLSTKLKCRVCPREYMRADARKKHEWMMHQYSDAKPQKRIKKRTYTPTLPTSPLRSNTEVKPSSSTQPLPRTSLYPHSYPSPPENSYFGDVCGVLAINPDYKFGLKREKSPSTPIHCGFCDKKFSGRLQRENRKLHIKFKHSGDVEKLKNSAVGWFCVHACGTCGAAYNQVDALRRHEMRQHPVANADQKPSRRELINLHARNDHVVGHPDLPLVSRIQDVTDVTDDREDEEVEEVKRGSSISAESFVSGIYDTSTNGVSAGIARELTTPSPRERLTNQELTFECPQDVIGAAEDQVKRSISLPSTAKPLERDVDRFSDLIQRSISTPYTSAVPVLAENPFMNTVLQHNQVSLFYASRGRPIIWDPDSGDICQRTNSWNIRHGLTVGVHSTTCHASPNHPGIPTRSLTVTIKPPMPGNVPFPGLIRSTSLKNPSFLESVRQLQQMRYSLRWNEQQPHYFRGDGGTLTDIGGGRTAMGRGRRLGEEGVGSGRDVRLYILNNAGVFYQNPNLETSQNITITNIN
ncbi:uncharacterized protein BDR25DRAFT_346849 [Lindgomyces ingoldianus]|uniref:Uncharacterized protein n=1 Tax=Lindgomyces ingoldianus TaxID=673940 RepID=A0ACB6QB81_9PLEO|nr:uncharacterized protein BDR25DRAFT_346849 [Lindgomyces ingoldianus]KAF2464176.1 hypothetical protein BDR25DRAFT_346849 [Lindgomyces ingoldianus]